MLNHDLLCLPYENSFSPRGDAKGLGPAVTNHRYDFRDVLFPLLALFSSSEFAGPDYEVPLSSEYRVRERM